MKYRFDDSVQNVYKYRDDLGHYVFVGTYLGFGISSDMSEHEKIALVDFKLLFEEL